MHMMRGPYHEKCITGKMQSICNYNFKYHVVELGIQSDEGTYLKRHNE